MSKFYYTPYVSAFFPDQSKLDARKQVVNQINRVVLPGQHILLKRDSLSQDMFFEKARENELTLQDNLKELFENDFRMASRLRFPTRREPEIDMS